MSSSFNRNSRANRDRRDASFERAVKAIAEQQAEHERCLWCGASLEDAKNSPYCSVTCGVAAEMEGE